MTQLKAKKKKERDGHEIAGRIITAFFAILLIVGIFFLVNLFKQREINYDNLVGTWKLKGEPSVVYVFKPYDEMKGFGIATSREVDSNVTTTYHYVLMDPEEDKSYRKVIMQPVDIAGYKAGDLVTIQITGISRAQLSVVMDSSKMKSMTRQDIF